MIGWYFVTQRLLLPIPELQQESLFSFVDLLAQGIHFSIFGLLQLELIIEAHNLFPHENHLTAQPLAMPAGSQWVGDAYFAIPHREGSFLNANVHDSSLPMLSHIDIIILLGYFNIIILLPPHPHPHPHRARLHCALTCAIRCSISIISWAIQPKDGWPPNFTILQTHLRG